MAFTTYADLRLAPYLMEFAEDAACPLHGYAPLHAFEQIKSGRNEPHTIQRIMPESFRREAADLSHRLEWAARDLSDVPFGDVSAAWSEAAQMRARFDGLSAEEQIRLVTLLVSLGMHSDVLKLVPKFPADGLSDPVTAELAFLRTVSQITSHYDYGTKFDKQALIDIMDNAPHGDMSRIRAAHALIVFVSKVGNDPALAHRAADAMQQAVNDRAPQNALDRHLLISRLYRGISMVPLMERDVAEVVRQMDEAEAHARAALAATLTKRQSLIARENLMTVLESRTKEAIFVGDLDLAGVRSSEQLSIDPHDPKNHIEFGDIHLRLGRLEEAREAFHKASVLGPPGVAVALFLAGQASEKLGDYQAATDYYMRTLTVDPEGYSALERLVKLGAELDVPGVEKWISTRLLELSDG